MGFGGNTEIAVAGEAYWRCMFSVKSSANFQRRSPILERRLNAAVELNSDWQSARGSVCGMR